MWNDISFAWQTAFSLAWEAYLHGSIPIGAVITDEAGAIISTGRNRIYEKGHTPNPKISHAEMEALQTLDAAKYTNPHGYTLYTTMEPCPMCMGTFVMANLRTLRVAARDAFCGAVHYIEKDPYLQRKNIAVSFAGGDLETVQLAMQAYHELTRLKGVSGPVVACFAQYRPGAVALAQRLYECRYLEDCAKKDLPFSAVFNGILSA